MTEWIKIIDNPPKEIGDYLIWVSVEDVGEFCVYEKYRPFIAWWNGEFFENYSDVLRVYLDTITHWAELPEPPA